MKKQEFKQFQIEALEGENSSSRKSLKKVYETLSVRVLLSQIYELGYIAGQTENSFNKTRKNSNDWDSFRKKSIEEKATLIELILNKINHED